MINYVLASASPRRVEILKKLGIEPRIMPSDIEERMEPSRIPNTPKERVEALSLLKASDIVLSLMEEEEAEKFPYLVIGSDTVVSVENKILEKPKDKGDAERMLRLIEGKKHEVFTAVTLIYLSEESKQEFDLRKKQEFDLKKIQNRETIEIKRKTFGEDREGFLEKLNKMCGLRMKTFTDTTEVFVYPMTDEEVEAYISSEEPYDKAGAYAIQGGFSKFIKGIKGEYSTVMGLPSGRLYQEMKGLLSECLR